MKFTKAQATKLAKEMKYKGDIDEFLLGLNRETEHGLITPATNVTNDNPVLTAKIVLAHLNKFPTFYTKIANMEKADAEKAKKSKKAV